VYVISPGSRPSLTGSLPAKQMSSPTATRTMPKRDEQAAEGHAFE